METSPSTALSDEALLARAKEGREEGREALGALLSRHARSLHRYFLWRVRDQEAARDMVQEVFVRVIRAGGRLPEGRGFRPWMWAIAVNVNREVRRRARARPKEVSLEMQRGPDDIPLSERLADTRPLPSGQAVQRERAERLREAVGRLDEDLGAVLHLKYFEERPCREVADTLGIAEGTVWSRTHRALERLREILGPEWKPGEGGSP